MTTINHQVKGVNVELQTLQKLRFLVQEFDHSKKKARALTSGSHRSTLHSRGMEFEEVRIYQAGDDVRTIDWRVTARTQTPHTKCFQEEKEKPVITLVDQRSSMSFGSRHCFKSVYACQLSAIINWSTLARGDRSGGMVIGAESIANNRPNRTKSSLNRWLQTLTDFNQLLITTSKKDSLSNKQEPSFEKALQQLDNITPSGAEIYLISDFYDLNQYSQSLLYKLAKHHTLHFYWLLDPLEVQLPLIDQATFTDGKNQRSLAVNSKIQQHHQSKFIEKKERLELLARQSRSELISVTTNTPLLDIYHNSDKTSVAEYGN